MTPTANKPYSRYARLRRWHVRLREPLLTLLLAIQIFSLFIMPTLRSIGLTIPHIFVVCVLLGFVTLAVASSRSRIARLMLIVSVIFTIFGNIWHIDHPTMLTDIVIAVGQVLTQLSLIWVISSAVFASGPVTHHRILGAIIIYLSVGVIFTDLYILLVQIVPGAITHLPSDAFDLRETLTYYSFGTMTTASFGDILPIHPIARSLANLEAISGQLFPATLLASIVAQLRLGEASKK